MSTQIDGHKVGAIKRAIETHIHPDSGRSLLYVDYDNWYVGITNNPSIRKAQHEYQKELTALYFKAWDADTKINSRTIEKHFHAKGMRERDNEGGANKNSTFVYVFKISHNLVDEITKILNLLFAG